MEIPTELAQPADTEQMLEQPLNLRGNTEGIVAQGENREEQKQGHEDNRIHIL